MNEYITLRDALLLLLPVVLFSFAVHAYSLRLITANVKHYAGLAKQHAGLNCDVDAGFEARALHRVVRGMHDGHCMECGHIAQAEVFNLSLDRSHVGGYYCPACRFTITGEEATAALLEFNKYGRESVRVFKAWAQKRKDKHGTQPAETACASQEARSCKVH